ncbi:hypothetical protein [Chitinophaga sedimenti]|uniref:hypothetical protein n=1 Tax=Chitinophaga sedimenti TaxID=2033606 RepID=UPI00249E1FDC|nr:hypothetical protein [Chitinophaga sedimenti]
MSKHLRENTPFPQRAPVMPGVYVMYAWGKQHPDTLLPHELLGVKPRDLSRLFRVDVQSLAHKLVMWHPVTFASAEQYELHRLLRAVDKNLLITQLPVEETAGADEVFLPPYRLLAMYEQYPDIVRNTLRVMDDCQLEFDFKAVRNRQTFTGDRHTDRELLREKALEGMQLRYGNQNGEALRRIEKELFIIDKMNFNAYFLITWDIICFAQSRGFFTWVEGAAQIRWWPIVCISPMLIPLRLTFILSVS